MNGLFRSGAFYALVFAGTGVSLPFIGLWFRAKGLSGSEIAITLAAPMLARLVTGPLIGVWGDSFRRRKTPLAILLVVAAAAYASMGVTEGLVFWLPLWFVAATCAGSVVPLADVLGLKLARKEDFVFAVARSAGSIAFILANIAMGAVLTITVTDAVIVWISLAAAIAAFAAIAVLPDELTHADGLPSRAADRFRGLGRLVGDRVFMSAIAAVGLVQAAHGFSYGFASLVWRAQGISEVAIGLLWAFGVVAEVAFMWLMEPFRRRTGPWLMLVIGGAAAVVRWTAMAFAPPLWLLWPLQALHALSFAASFLAGLQLVDRLSPPQSVSVAQTLSSALSAGVLMGLATIVSGPLYDAYGAGGFGAMAVIAGMGLVLALTIRRGVEPQPQSAGEGGSIIEPR